MMKSASLTALLLLAAGCGASSVQQSAPGAATTPTVQQAAIDKDRRWAIAMENAQKAAVIGGLFGGPFGAPASMGMGAIGFIYGMITADSQIAEQNIQAQARYQKEAEKDRQLEAALEKEIERQRALENQIAGITGQPPSTEPVRLPQASSQPVQPPPPAGPQPGSSTSAISAAPQQNTTIARISSPPATAPFRNVEVRDINNDGVPDVWIYYNPQKPGEVLRKEEASKGNGQVDSWSYFRDGQMVRRDVDSKGAGRPDTIFYYENNQIAREERDETGRGSLTYRATYDNGRLARVERDTAGRGRADLWVFYDISRDGEVVLKEERDLNGDGIVDLWSIYDNGRLVRRDVSAIGLEILSRQDQSVPLPTAELRPPTLPGT